MSREAADPVRRAAELVETWSGVSVSESQLPVLAEDLARIGGPEGAAGVVARLLGGDHAAREAILARVTPPETYFFRHASHFQILASLVRSRRADGRACTVLSAGCSTGEEAWSAAVILAALDGGEPPAGRLRDSVIGWDLAADRVARAARGRYRAWSVRAGLAGYDALFRRDGDEWEVQPRVRGLVRFEQQNLLDPALPWPGRFDAIFFRNVAIYWKQETVERACENLTRLLASDGVFLLGPCDPVPAALAGWPTQLVDGAQAYRPPPPPCYAPTRRPPPPAAPVPAAAPLPAAAWVPAPPLPTTRAAGDAGLMAELEALAARGAHAEALDRLRSRRSPATILDRRCEAVLLLHLGREAEALALFRQCVFLEPEDPAHRRWLAVGLAALGRNDDAERENRNALALER